MSHTYYSIESAMDGLKDWVQETINDNAEDAAQELLQAWQDAIAILDVIDTGATYETSDYDVRAKPNGVTLHVEATTEYAKYPCFGTIYVSPRRFDLLAGEIAIEPVSEAILKGVEAW